ncbi:MoaD/ThiS family protein [Georgenia deserti]|uniref:MoaD/ThiS family protein n=1 Tax=Georgenia deserti TaxID=2093781 RepID=A0ABW4L1U0_9MICO
MTEAMAQQPAAPTDQATRVRLRYFAAAAEAAGTSSEDLAVRADCTVGELVETLTVAHGPQLGRVLAISSLLVDGQTRVVADDGAARLSGAAEVGVDVLPPFAGG